MNKKLRVLLIAEACNPTFTSVPLVGYNVARALAERGDLEITLVSHVRNQAALEIDPIAKLVTLSFIDSESIARPLYRLSKLLRGGQGLSWTTGTAMAWPSYMYFERKLFQKFKGEFELLKFDIVHRVTPLTPTVGSPLAQWIETPMVLGPLNGGLPWPAEYPELRNQEREWLVPVRGVYKHLPFFRSTYMRIAAVISGSRHTATEVPSYFSGKRFLMPENGIDTKKFPINREWVKPHAEFRFITVGRLVPYKGTDMVLEAMSGSQLLRACKLIVIGDGPQRPALEAQVTALGLDSSVRLAGWKTQIELADELRQAHAFTFPSLREFGGGVVLEAMACGLPCVVADYGGPAELVDRTCGILLPVLPRAEFVVQLRSAMEALVLDPDRCRAMSESGKDRARVEFTWEAKAEKINNVYRMVLGA